MSRHSPAKYCPVGDGTRLDRYGECQSNYADELYCCGTHTHGDDYEWCEHCDSCDSCCSCEPPMRAPWHDLNYPDDHLNPKPEHITDDEKAHGDGLYAATRFHTLQVDPSGDMASFYLLEFALAHGSFPETAEVLRQIRQEQDALVGRCDTAFLLYGYSAIGGELRHHSGIRRYMPGPATRRGKYPSERNRAWRSWHVLGMRHGYAKMLEWSCAIFMNDSGFPDSGFGGESWRDCADIVLRRLDGRLDSRTFVDRCFALQHNGGSFLNKGHWRKPERGWRNSDELQADDCREVGNAHHSNPTDLYILLEFAATKHKVLFNKWLRLHNKAARHLCKAPIVVTKPNLQSGAGSYEVKSALPAKNKKGQTVALNKEVQRPYHFSYDWLNSEDYLPFYEGLVVDQDVPERAYRAATESERCSAQMYAFEKEQYSDKKFKIESVDEFPVLKDAVNAVQHGSGPFWRLYYNIDSPAGGSTKIISENCNCYPCRTDCGRVLVPLTVSDKVRSKNDEAPF